MRSATALLELLILWRNERERAHPAPEYLTTFQREIDASLDTLEKEAAGIAATPFGIGHVAIGCALSYIDFRFPDLDWRKDHPQIAAWHKTFSERPSARADRSAGRLRWRGRSRTSACST